MSGRTNYAPPSTMSVGLSGISLLKEQGGGTEVISLNILVNVGCDP